MNRAPMGERCPNPAHRHAPGWPPDPECVAAPELDLDAIEARSDITRAMQRTRSVERDEDVMRLVAEVRRLRRWKDEALPVMQGLQELGGALGLPLGSSITGRQAVDAALDLRLRAETPPR